ncbi:MAG: cytidine deaminase [Candidatus Dadabacteria bacterium]|nr:MAG: cytidine deaminase [Candidatus Dadabacteria bacterium]
MESEVAISSAKKAYDRCYCPYGESGKIGVCLVGKNGDIFLGSCIQNAAYPSTLNSVAGAVVTANVSGVRQFREAVIYGEVSDAPHSFYEYIGENNSSISLILANDSGLIEERNIEFGRDLPRGRHVEFKPFHAAHFSGGASEDALKGMVGLDLEALWNLLLKECGGKGLSFKNFESVALEAVRGSLNAYAPYSGFAVGSAILFADNQIVSGCNFEVKSFERTICAERAALLGGVTKGCVQDYTDSFVEQIRLLVNFTPTPIPAEPCGACRQALLEVGTEFALLSICQSDSFTFVPSFTSGQILKGCGEKGELAVKERVSEGGLVPAPFTRKNLT